MSDERLMVFARAPEPGRVKTRLAGLLGPERAAALQAAFLRDVVARHARPGRALTVWQAGALDDPIWPALGVPLRPQIGADLGERLRHAFAAELSGGARVVVLGTDSPTLPPGLVDAAFAALAEVPVVVGPAQDGGYYLLGQRGRPEALPDLFTGIGWGGERVLIDTLGRLEAAAIRYRVQAFWYDVDREADLDLLRAHLPALEAAGEPVPVHTRALLPALGRDLEGPRGIPRGSTARKE